MESGESSNRATSRRPGPNPWLIIMLTAPVPLLLLVFFFVKWYHQKTDYTRLTKQFVQRQNAILAADALSVSSSFSDILEKAVRDAHVLSLVAPTASNYIQFYGSQIGELTQMDPKSDASRFVPLPFYNEISLLDLSGNEILFLKEGKTAPTRKLSDCSESQLCDRTLREKALELKTGEIQFGKLLRWYSPEGSPEISEGASYHVAFRGEKGIYLLGIDYRHLKDYLTIPTFPYEPKRNLIQAYENGNYIYIVDNDYDVLIHPKYWNVGGIDPKTGRRVAPMKTDSDEGTHPINVAAYESGSLKDYFERLTKRSFVQTTGVDIFHSPNLGGTTRILSVAPVLYSKAKFKKTGIFGWVIIGCNVDFFEEPKERVVPYY